MKNIISVQIYSDNNTPWDRTKIDFPIDLNTRWPSNGCGLCNQLFKIINTLSYVDKEYVIYLDLFSKDYLSGETTPISNILDLEEMRSKSGYNLYDIIDYDYENEICYIHNDNYVFRSYQQNLDLFVKNLNNLSFNKELEETALKIIKNKELETNLVNLSHVRIDIDFKNHILSTSGEKSYLDLIENYRNEIYNNCDKSIPLVLLLEETNHYFVNELRKDYNIITFEKSDVLKVNKNINGRELFALIDLLIGKNLNVNTFIGTEKSSFSIVLDKLNKYKKSIIIK